MTFMNFRKKTLIRSRKKNHVSTHRISFEPRSTCLRRARFSFLLSGAILFLVSSLLAQVDRSGLSGIVTDPSGLVLPEAHVVAVHNATGMRRETVTTPEGTYDIPELPIGVYTVTFSHDGFQTLSFTNVVQAIQSTRTLNAALSVSGTEERVQVAASTEQLAETSNTMGARVEKAQAEKLPLNGRNWANLTALVPAQSIPGAATSARFDSQAEDGTTIISLTTASTLPTSSTKRSKPTSGWRFPSMLSRSFV